MKILALDIGAGTEDVLIYDDAKESVENCLKMVLPSPSQVYAAQVRSATRICQDLFINGDIIGGGVLSSALKKHIEAGLRVTMTEHAAYTVRNVLDEVIDLGITITSKDPPVDFKGKMLTLEEVNLTKLKDFLVNFNEPLFRHRRRSCCGSRPWCFPARDKQQAFSHPEDEETLRSRSKTRNVNFQRRRGALLLPKDEFCCSSLKTTVANG